MKKAYYVIALFLLTALPSVAQKWAVKTNLLYDASLTPNIGVEYQMGKKITGQLIAGYNVWTFKDNRKWKHVLVQPEVRYWLCSPYAGHFFGAHLIYSHYNVGNVHLPFGILPGLRNHRYQGDLGAIGVSYGYSWMLNNRWSIEASAGVGYAITRYRKYNCTVCGTYHGISVRHAPIPTRLSVSLIYYIH